MSAGIGINAELLITVLRLQAQVRALSEIHNICITQDDQRILELETENAAILTENQKMRALLDTAWQRDALDGRAFQCVYCGKMVTKLMRDLLIVLNPNYDHHPDCPYLAITKDAQERR